ncbi:hypothetical protein [Acanthamoeba polyphaga mimivirus]|uniref:Uncharacterized protein n=1 Tax=Acanthamoeba polyphaga mimivirus TaxID=212035 RepID=A0A0G2Y0T7_MIMIV|nr:hypothetical protein [Acanthamoeba castellanii mamavirus]AKI79270.1 hypothetical protein [Acanthamoeba polyphaga mimivirus]UMZ07980.1 hypothetical protein [Acanthamoeba polyphaga mimivirus]
MDNIDSYDNYSEELSSFNPIFRNFTHITSDSENLDSQFIKNSLGVDLDKYTKDSSLLFMIESEYFCDFCNGKPLNLIKYYLLVVLGSSKDVSDPIGYIPYLDKSSIHDCNLYNEFFMKHPHSLLQQDESSCNGDCKLDDLMTLCKWCPICYNKLCNATNLQKILRSAISFTAIPQSSVLYVRRNTKKINYNDINDLELVKKFLNYDKLKIECIKQRIENADNKIKTYVEMITKEKIYNTKILETLLEERGGSLENYNCLITGIDSLLNKNTDN